MTPPGTKSNDRKLWNRKVQQVAKIFYKEVLMMEIRRDFYLDNNKLIKRKNNELIKVITGIRRFGKSYLLNNLLH